MSGEEHDTEYDELDIETPANFRVIRKYRETDPDPKLLVNPMALVFPMPVSNRKLDEKVFKSLRERPDDFHKLSLQTRLGYLEYIDEFHCTFDMDMAVIHKTIAVVRKSFLARNPSNPLVMNAVMRVMAGEEVIVPRTSEAGAGGGLGMLIMGRTGTGKSALIDRLVAYLGAYGRIHLQLNGQPARWPQLGVIRVNAQKSWPALLRDILAEVDRQTGRAFWTQRAKSRTGTALRWTVSGALSSGFAPLLVIDEMQRLAKLAHKDASEILDGLIDLMGMRGVPVLLVGTVRVKRLLERFSSEMDKFTTGGLFEVEPLVFPSQETSNFIFMLKDHCVSTRPVQYSTDFDSKLIDHCMGIRRIMREYMRVVLTRHARNETLEANGDLLNDIESKELERFTPALTALRKERLGFKLNYQDLEDYEDYLAKAIERPKADSVRLESTWRVDTQTPLGGSESTPLTADLYAEFRDSLVQTRELRKLQARTKAIVVDPFDEGLNAEHSPPKSKPAKRGKTSRERAASKAKSISNVVPLAAVKPNEIKDEGVDPSRVS